MFPCEHTSVFVNGDVCNQSELSEADILDMEFSPRLWSFIIPQAGEQFVRLDSGLLDLEASGLFCSSKRAIVSSVPLAEVGP